MNKKLTVLLLLSTLLLFVGCSQKVEPPNNLKEAQELFEKTSWYWSPCKWMPAAPVGYKFFNNHGLQAIFVCTNLEKIIYDEIEPQHGLKSFRGAGKLESPPELKPPLFLLQCDYTASNTNTFIIVGFVSQRMFWVTGESEGDKKSVFANSYSIATNALKQLGDINFN
jgi:hypothetical protein